MKRLLTLLLTTGILFILVACNNQDDATTPHEDDATTPHEDDAIYPLEVELTAPQDVAVGEETEFRAYVSMNNEPLKADRVQFEVMKEEESLVMLDGEYEEEGNYTASYTFKEPGTYQVIAHTDAQNQHTMPVEEIIVE